MYSNRFAYKHKKTIYDTKVSMIEKRTNSIYKNKDISSYSLITNSIANNNSVVNDKHILVQI